MEEKGHFAILSEQLQKMERVDEVDISVVDTLNKMIEDCRLRERFWIENEGKPVDLAFLLYHASRNSRIILEKMKQRFFEAKEKHENPRVIGDSLVIMPFLSELCFTISYSMKREVTDELQNLISRARN